jgi:SAM-dependent methyltransferase
MHQERTFGGAAAYWQARYAAGRTSGAGSRGALAAFKADIVNTLAQRYAVRDAIEFGCGDGAQLSLLRLPTYLGLDVSPAALARCRRSFGHDPTRRFALLDEYRGEQADLALSLDVIYHLVADAAFEAHMAALFGAARRIVLIYSCDEDAPVDPRDPHVRRRRFTPWVAARAPDWRLVARIPNPYPWRGDVHTGSWSDFYLYGRADGGG